MERKRFVAFLRLEHRARRPRAGLTLVEMMVVIAIIGTLMTVIAVNVAGYLERTNVDTTRLQMGRIAEVLTAYSARNHGKVPSTSEGLEALQTWLPEGQVPVDAWGNAFVYEAQAGGSARPYQLTSLGKDGQPGGSGYDADLVLGQPTTD